MENSSRPPSSGRKDHGEGNRRIPAIPPAAEGEVVERLAKSEHPSRIADGLGCSERTVRRFRDDRRDEIAARQDEIRLATLRDLQEHGEEVRGAMLASAKDPENRNQPQAYRVISESAGLIGKNSIHIGDVNNVTNATQVNLDPEALRRVISEYDPVAHAERRRRLGLSDG